jgi:heme-degrading monooxygenase HmoA
MNQGETYRAGRARKLILLPIRANEFGQEFVEFLTKATEVSVRRAPGFVSASLHRSTDGTKVTMYARWRSIDDYQAMRQDPAPLPFLQEALTIARFEPGVYEVVRTFTPAGEPN